MSKDVYTLFSKTARQCAPVIMGIKEANLLKINTKNEKKTRKLFEGTNIEMKKLYSINQSSVYIVYKRNMLESYVRRPENMDILLENDYRDMDFDSMLNVLSARCRKWTKDYNDYPHEIGIFLGYPTNDVKGFIKNKGHNFLEMGYWKVYSDVNEARRLFSAYNEAEDKVMKYFYANAVCDEAENEVIDCI